MYQGFPVSQQSQNDLGRKKKKVMTIWPEHGWLLWFVFFSILKIIPSHPNSQKVKVVHQVLRGYYEKRANPLGWRNHLCDLFFLPLKVSTGDKQVPLQQWQTACFHHPSPGSLQRFGIPLMCFSGETNTGSEILSSKQEPKDQIIYGFPLWVNCFHCLHLIWAAVTRRKFPSNIFFFLKMLPPVWVPSRRKKQDAIRSWGHSQCFVTPFYAKVATTEWESLGEDYTTCGWQTFSLSVPEWREQKHWELSSLEKEQEEDHNHQDLKTACSICEGTWLNTQTGDVDEPCLHHSWENHSSQLHCRTLV